jgi:ATP-dependent RNA helicase RhlE
MQFKQLNIIEPILKALVAQNYSEPTPIQTEAIPPLLKGLDVLGCAQTGTGKTAAFAIPILQNMTAKAKQIRGKKQIMALVVAPTRTRDPNRRLLQCLRCEFTV